MKSTENFKKVIKAHLDKVAKKDEEFSKKLEDPNKTLDKCITYILNQVKKSGCNGFEDSEIFGMATHYYDEKDVKPGSPINMDYVVNHHVELTDEEIEKLKQDARDKVMNDEMQRLKKKPKKKKEENKSNELSLF